MTFHTQVVGANGQRQAMFIERMPGLAEVILSNFRFGPQRRDDDLLGQRPDRRAGGDGPRRARPAGLRVIAVTSVAQSLSAEPEPAAGQRLLEVADLVLDLCTPHADAMVTIRRAGDSGRPWVDGRRRRHRQRHQVRTAELLVERGAMPPVISRASAVGAERSRELFDEAYREHARRLARAIDQQGGG